MLLHPRKNENGQAVKVPKPHIATPLVTWSDPNSTAVVVPDGPMPEVINGIAVQSWADAPCQPSGWAHVVGQADIGEPAFTPPQGKQRASGVVVLEQDGRVWLAAPTNGFGGYKQSFPKGKTDKGLPMQANAIKEAYEEAGLQVEIDAHLIDSLRDTSYTRYYVSHRVSGNPADMSWESQAVLLVPLDELPKYLNNANDKPVYEALKQYMQSLKQAEPNTSLKQAGALTKADIFRTGALDFFPRIFDTLQSFHDRHNRWPNRLFMSKQAWSYVQKDILTELGWKMFTEKLMPYEIDSETIIAADDLGNAFEYQVLFKRTKQPADWWIWGVNLHTRLA